MSKYPVHPLKTSSATQRGRAILKGKGTENSSRRVAVSSRPNTKPEVKKSSGGSSNVKHGRSKQSQSQLNFDEIMKRINYLIDKIRGRSKQSQSQLNFDDERMKRINYLIDKIRGCKSSTKGLAVGTSSQEAMIIGDDYRKRKWNELEVSSAEIGSVPSKKAIGELSFCGICMEWKLSTKMFKSDCSHSFCLDCISSHVAAKIRDNVVKVKCPDSACQVFFEPHNCRSFVPKQVIERWEAVLCESLLGANKFYCPFRDCSGLMVVDDSDQAVTSAECPYCHRLFCAQCRVPWHSGSQCKAKVDYLDNKFAKLAKKEKWQKCHNCKFYVQKTHGCESIKCRCGYRFCYVCGGRWHYGHLCPRRS